MHRTAVLCLFWAQLCQAQDPDPDRERMTNAQMASFPTKVLNKVMKNVKRPTGCAVHTSCTECSSKPGCAWCMDQGFGNCQADMCRNWASRKCSCEKAYRALFPGLTMEEKGPCSKALKGSFKPGTCSASSACPKAADNMLNECKNKKIPNIPPGNPTAGDEFDRNRALMIKMAYKRAGCPLHAALPPPPTPAPPPVHYTIKANYRGDCPEDKYSGSQCNVKNSAEAQAICEKDKSCQFYVWSGKYGRQFEADDPTANAEFFPQCLWMCKVVPKIFRSWKEGQDKYLEGWESGWKSGATHTPAPTPPPLHKVTVKVTLAGISKAAFHSHPFCIAVAAVLGVPEKAVSVTSVANAPPPHFLLRRLEESVAVAIGAKAAPSIVVTFCVSTTDEALEEKAEGLVKSDNFPTELKQELAEDGIKVNSLQVGGHVTVQQQSQKSAAAGGPSIVTVLVLVVAVALIGAGVFVGMNGAGGGAKTLLEGGWNPEDEIEPDAAETQSLTQNTDEKKKKKKKKKSDEAET